MDFASDNTSGIHPEFLKAIASVNQGHMQSYGMDPVTDELDKAFKKHFGNHAQGFLVFNGTAANVLGLSPFLKSYEGIICSDSSHLHLDECGAPELFMGSKLLLTSNHLGKIKISDIENHIKRRGDQHHVQAKVLSITQPTEWGTVYTLSEIQDFQKFCKDQKLIFHIDGARLANAAVQLDCTLRELTQGADVVSFGGTKNGMMAGEAVIFLNDSIESRNFKFVRKQGLNLASKHRFLSAQFLAYLENDLWKRIAAHSCQLAKMMEAGILSNSKISEKVKIMAPVESNGLFVQIPNQLIGKLKKKHFFYVWDESHSIVRWMLSWDHTDNDVKTFLHNLEELL